MFMILQRKCFQVEDLTLCFILFMCFGLEPCWSAWHCGTAWGLVRPEAEAQQKKVRIVFVALKPHKMTFLNIFHDRSPMYLYGPCVRKKNGRERAGEMHDRSYASESQLASMAVCMA